MESGAIRTGYLLVIAARPEAALVKSTDAAKQFCYALKKAGLLP